MNVNYVNDVRQKEDPNYYVATNVPPEEKIEEKRTNLLSSISPLVFPPDLADEIYIEFNAFTPNTTRAEEAKRTFTFEKSLYLPFPQSVTDQYGASYSQDNLFFGGEFLKNSLDTLMTSSGTKKIENLMPGSGVADRAGNLIASVMEKIGASPTKSLAAAATYGLSGVGGPIAAAAKTSLNVTTNPYPVMIYQGTGFKSFAFSWTFFPESSKESDIIKKIIGYFRREMLPERIDGVESILRYPAVFEIKIRPEVKVFKRCVISNLDVNYTPAGPAFVKEFPVQSSNFIEPAAITMTISFQEIEMWLANDFHSEESKNFHFIDADRKYV